MHFDYEQTLASFGPHYANQELYFRVREGMEGEGDLFARGFCAAWQSYAVD